MKGLLANLTKAAAVLTMSGTLQAGARDAQWQRVEQAVHQGLPRTAITELEPIIQGALADRAWAEATKAITRKIVLEGELQGNRPEERISRLQAELAQAPRQIVPVLETILAEWYWQYYQQNRWRFLQRTRTTGPPGKDFTTWDLPRIFAEIERHFTLALAQPALLQAIPIGAYDALLVKGTQPDRYRPTLYDFLAHEALTFYQAGEQAGTKPEDAFEVSATSDILGPVAAFLAWQPTTTETNAPAYKAIQLYQQLLRFHQPDTDPGAFLAADLDRLVYAKNIAGGDERNRRFEAAMEGFAREHGDDEVASYALYELALVCREEGDVLKAHDRALRGRNAHPQSPGGKLCANLAAELEAKEAMVTTERVWNQPAPDLQVRYRNVTEVYFRLVAWDWNQFLAPQVRTPPGALSDGQRRALLARPPVRAWAEALPPTRDFKTHTATFPAPTGLKPGFYYLLASYNPAFSEADNQLSLTSVWVSDLALVLRLRDSMVEGLVLDARSGEPLAEANVQTWERSPQGLLTPGPERTTDTNGCFSFKAPGQGYVLRARWGDQALATGERYAWPQTEAPQPAAQTVFFTDRALYRPGQAIQYKGICLRADPAKDDYHVLANQRLTVVFSDVNGKEIARAPQQANDYGSFAGTFLAPRDRLLGRMRLQVSEGPPGTTWLEVEEYKRPKFQVTLQAPTSASKLGQKVTVKGQALAYTGAAVDGGAVTYQVTREVRMPWWWGWYGGRAGFPGPSRASQQIAHGRATTRADGSFEIDFVAHPDPTVPEKDDPTFVFRIHADVTDSAGETRSADRQVRLGYTALEVRLEAAEWQTEDQPVTVDLSATSLDDEPQRAEGTLQAYSLKAPATVPRASLFGSDGERLAPDEAVLDDAAVRDPSDPNTWPLDKVVAEQGFTTDKAGKATVRFALPAGAYRVLLTTQDRFGRKVTARRPVAVLRPAERHLAIKVPHLLAMPKASLAPGEEFMALWGTGYDTGRAFIEIEHRHRLLARYWTKPDETQAQIRLAVTEAMRGGFTLHVTQVRENRAYLDSRHIDVPWTDKDLTLKWEHFTSRLEPGQKETWTLRVAGPGARKAAAEMVATLYDASLDAFLACSWPHALLAFREDLSDAQAGFENEAQMLEVFRQTWSVRRLPVGLTYRAFPPELMANVWGNRLRAFGAGLGMSTRKAAVRSEEFAAAAPMMAAAPAVVETRDMLGSPLLTAGLGPAGRTGAARGAEEAARGEAAPPAPDLSHISARKNLTETAFFFPQLLADTNGEVRLRFTMPEALTEWRFLGFAHDRACRGGLLEAKAVTAKDLMVQPNPPRFLREGDVIAFTVKVSNLSSNVQEGKVRLTFRNALTDAPVDALLGNREAEQTFRLPANASRGFAWRVTVPDGLSALAYQAVAASAAVSDGEEGLVPVLARRVLVTESLPLAIRGPATKHFVFEHLAGAGKSKTLVSQALTVQMVSNPAWYAVMALPYLMEYPYECTEQTFNRLYANALARSLAAGDPRIRRVFDEWKATPALDSPLEKSQELKSVLLEESPWLRQAEAEGRARKNVGLLFDNNRLTYESARAEQKLAQAQLDDGAWPWFPGGPANSYITLYITTGFGRLRHLGVDLPVAPALRALNHLDAWIAEVHRRSLEGGQKDANHLTPTIALYLYGRSFFLKDRPLAGTAQEAVAYFLGQARQYWLALADRQSQGHLALALARFDDQPTARAIMKSLKERSVTDDELGRFWRDTEGAWWWYRAPIETQALMIEAFSEVTGDTEAVEQCKTWLLKQKQTQDWRTTKATADAVYALLLRGHDLLGSSALVEVALGGKTIRADHVEAGTGFYEQRIVGTAIKPALSRITVTKTDPGVAWGGVHWQYLEDQARVAPYAGSPLKLVKTLYVKQATAHGPVLAPVRGPLAVGDELVVRLELRTDRDLEFVHLKDERGSGVEPEEVLSGYRAQDGLGYYETTRDTATHFFLDYLPKGTHVFEYRTRVQLRGDYQSGLASIQCLYAPEFNSHSQSYRLEVR